MELIEEDGLDALTMRRLAAKLKCEAMSLYHHFPSKAHLMDALLDRVVGTVEMPPRDLPFGERLRKLALDWREMALANPKFFQFVALHRLNTAVGLRWLNGALGLFREAGFSPEATARLFRAYGYYVTGALLDETAGYAKGPSAAEPVPDDIVRRDYPEITTVGPFFNPMHHRATFEAGLNILVEGIVEEAGRRQDPHV
jgi:AcrR family transcriptional regulator